MAPPRAAAASIHYDRPPRGVDRPHRLLLSTLHVAAGQSSPEAFLYKELQSFEPKARFKPQTPKQRLHAYLLTLAGPATLFTEAGAAGLSQIVDSPSQWGQGAAGYGKRFANDMAYNGVRYSLAFGTSILLQEDDRYFASEETRRMAPRAARAGQRLHRPQETTAARSSPLPA